MTTTMSPTEALTQWSDQVSGAMRDWWDSTSQAWDPLWRAWSDPLSTLYGGGSPGAHTHLHEHHTQHGHGHGHGHGLGHGHEHGRDHRHGQDCGCERRGAQRTCCDPCTCCIPEADVVVHTRVGERRVVPFEVCNERHRERQVTLAVGEWVSCDGPAVEVKATLAPAGELTLAPCDCQLVRLVVGVAVAPAQTDPQPDPATGEAPGRERTLDLDSCASAYADVRFEGCARPVRVAVVVHPASCDAFVVDCDRGCC